MVHYYANAVRINSNVCLHSVVFYTLRELSGIEQCSEMPQLYKQQKRQVNVAKVEMTIYFSNAASALNKCMTA